MVYTLDTDGLSRRLTNPEGLGALWFPNHEGDTGRDLSASCNEFGSHPSVIVVDDDHTLQFTRV